MSHTRNYKSVSYVVRTVFGYYVDGPESFGIVVLGQGFTWLDAGTHESLVEATNFVKTVETHQHRKIACLEEIGYLNGWITREQLEETYEVLKKNQYKESPTQKQL